MLLWVNLEIVTGQDPVTRGPREKREKFPRDRGAAYS